MNLYIFENNICYPVIQALIIAENEEEAREILLDKYKYEPSEFNEKWELISENSVKKGFITKLEGE